MSTFDAERFALCLYDGAEAFVDAPAAKDLLRAIRFDVEAVVAAIEVSRNPERSRRHRHQLEQDLPKRERELVEAVSRTAQPHLEAELEKARWGLLAVLRAFTS